MESRILQIESITRNELLSDFENVISKISNSEIIAVPSKIIVLNRKSAARILDCSLNFFDKLCQRGCVPCTVHYPYKNKSVLKWCEHHLQLIKPLIDNLKYIQDNKTWMDTAKEIRKKLGL